MEHHSFFKLVEDYESLGGNDYVHNTILPAMNELDVIPMDDLEELTKLYVSRRAKQLIDKTNNYLLFILGKEK